MKTATPMEGPEREKMSFIKSFSLFRSKTASEREKSVERIISIMGNT